MKKLASILDTVAAELETRGLTKLAFDLDTVANSLEKLAERPTEAYIFSPDSSKDGNGHYPIPDVKHAHSALSYAAAEANASPNGKPDWSDLTNAKVEERVRSAVKAKFPSIELDTKDKAAAVIS